MTENVRFDIHVKDLGSSALAKFTSNANKHVNRIKELTGSLDRGLSGTSVKVNKLSRSFSNLSTSNKGLRGFNKSLSVSNGHLDRMQQKLNRIKLTGSNLDFEI